MKKITIIGVIIVLVIAGWFFFKGSQQQVSKLDTIDTVGDFYNQWLKATKEPTDTNPSQADLAKSPILSKTLSDRLVRALKQPDTVIDPVSCQEVAPENISIRKMYERTDQAQVLVTSRDKKITNQATITLMRLNDGWYISDIQCSLGEFEPEREFSFERGGYLIKASVPSPYDSKNWHLVFEENGEPGHVVPLFFESESQCTNLDGSKSVCKPDQFKETTKVFVYGQMTESGVNVDKQEFVK